MYFLDIAFPEIKVDIEVDGPFHFYPRTREPVAKDLFKDRIMTGLGWNVVHLNYWEWEEDRDSCIIDLSK